MYRERPGGSRRGPFASISIIAGWGNWAAIGVRFYVVGLEWVGGFFSWVGLTGPGKQQIPPPSASLRVRNGNAKHAVGGECSFPPFANDAKDGAPGYAPVEMTWFGGSADNSRFLRCATEWKCQWLRNGNVNGYGMEMSMAAEWKCQWWREWKCQWWRERKCKGGGWSGFIPTLRKKREGWGTRRNADSLRE